MNAKEKGTLRQMENRCNWKMWVFPKIGVPQNGWFIRENSIKMDDLGVPLFLEHPCVDKRPQTLSHVFFADC